MRRLLISLVLIGLAFAGPAGAETFVQRVSERHVAIGDVIAHVLQDGTAYAVEGTTVMAIAPSAVRISAGRVKVTLPNGTRLRCVLPVADRDALTDTFRQSTGRTYHAILTSAVTTWVTDCPDGPGVIWTATEQTTIHTHPAKGH